MLIPKKNRKEVYKYLFKGEGRFLGLRCMAMLLMCAWCHMP